MTARRRFAEGTEVAVSKTKTELDELLAKHGATQRTVGEDDEQGRAVIVFRMGGRHVRLEVRLTPDQALPDPENAWADDIPHGWRSWTVERRRAWRAQKLEQYAREAWRRVLLVTKAKLELVADGTTTVEREFLADLLMPDGQTVHEAIAGHIEKAYLDGQMRPLLPPVGGTS